jgi:nucleotide-binding universal stress UspA family protein
MRTGPGQYDSTISDQDYEMANQNPFVDPSPKPTVGAATAGVLVGMDGSETSWHALSWACGEARRLRRRAVVVFVSSSAGSGTPASALIGAFLFDCGWNEPTATEQAETLGREVQCYAASHGVDLTFVHTYGDTASELLRLARVHHVDQIVVGRSVKARHHLAGSLGRRLAGKREAPVVVVVP